MKKLLIILCLFSCSHKVTTLATEKQKAKDKSELAWKAKMLVVVVVFGVFVDMAVKDLRE